LLCAVALAISGYLAWTAFNAKEVYGCGGGEIFDCGHVLNSQYSKIFGVPVSVPAFGLYATLLSVLTFFRPSAPEKLLKVGWGILTVGGISAGLAALWFSGIQVFELQHLCFYCLIAHACGLTLAALVIWRRPFNWAATSQLAAFSALGVAGLMTGQMMAEPPQTFTVETYENVSDVPGDSQASFEAPGGTEEFGAPVEFGAPMEFAPPTEFAPPVEFTPPGIETVSAEGPIKVKLDNNVSGGPTVEVIKTKTSAKPAKPATKDAAATPQDATSDATTAVPGDTDDVTAAAYEQNSKTVGLARKVEQPTKMRVTFPGATYLYFAASGSKTATRLLTAFSGLVAETKTSDESTETADESATDKQSSNAAAVKQTVAKPVVVTPSRVVTVAGKRFSLNTRHWPLLGNPDAKYVFVEMFDYTCIHCRKTHQTIEGAFDQYGDELAIIALPVPLERSCNVYAKGSGHAGACEQAKLAVAVWRCERSKFEDFHHWMFEATRTTSQARSKAEQLVGKDKLAAELALPHATAYISKHVDLYQKVGQGAVPKLMFPKSTMTGQVSSIATLCSTIERELAIKK